MATKRYNAPETNSASVDHDDYYGSQPAPEKLFDITCTIGTVWSGGDANPRVVAFGIIAEHSEGRSGTYSFPNPDGAIVSVTVEEYADSAKS